MRPAAPSPSRRSAPSAPRRAGRRTRSASARAARPRSPCGRSSRRRSASSPAGAWPAALLPSLPARRARPAPALQVAPPAPAAQPARAALRARGARAAHARPSASSPSASRSRRRCRRPARASSPSPAPPEPPTAAYRPPSEPRRRDAASVECRRLSTLGARTPAPLGPLREEETVRRVGGLVEGLVAEPGEEAPELLLLRRRHLHPGEDAAVVGAVVSVVEEADVPALADALEKAHQRARPLWELEPVQHLVLRAGAAADEVADVQL